MKDIAKKVFEIEIESLKGVAEAIGDEFTSVVNAVLAAKGKVIVTGIGKSGIIGKKIAATLSSTGTPSFFLHPGEAFHGDLGMVGAEDIILIISYSGETDEVLRLIPFFTWNKNLLIGMSGNASSTLARNCNHHLNIHIKQEACPLALAPTSSTTAALVMGDALAVALMECRNFQQEDFARFHPGGTLGRKLLVSVKDYMRTDNLPFITEEASFTELLLRMSEGRLGMVIVGSAQYVKGVITDGDLRRALIKTTDTTQLSVTGMMSPTPVFIDENEPVGMAEQLILKNKIATVLVGSAVNRSISGVYQIFGL